MYSISDGNACEKMCSWKDAICVAERWYEYLASDVEFMADKLVANYADVEEGNVDALNKAVYKFENDLAEILGYEYFYGHGNYSVSPASHAGFSLKVSEEEN